MVAGRDGGRKRQLSEEELDRTAELTIERRKKEAERCPLFSWRSPGRSSYGGGCGAPALGVPSRSRARLPYSSDSALRRHFRFRQTRH